MLRSIPTLHIHCVLFVFKSKLVVREPGSAPLSSAGVSTKPLKELVESCIKSGYGMQTGPLTMFAYGAMSNMFGAYCARPDCDKMAMLKMPRCFMSEFAERAL